MSYSWQALSLCTVAKTLSVFEPIAEVCYLRLDFESFNLLGPSDSVETDGGACSRDSFKVTVISFLTMDICEMSVKLWLLPLATH